MKDKRQDIRWQVNKKMNFSLTGNSPVALDGVLNDISISGARICLKEKLPPENSFNLNLRLKDDIGIEGLKTTVIWQREMPDANTYGLCFEKIGEIDKNRIYAFVYDSFSEEIKEPPWKKR